MLMLLWTLPPSHLYITVCLVFDAGEKNQCENWSEWSKESGMDAMLIEMKYMTHNGKHTKKYAPKPLSIMTLCLCYLKQKTSSPTRPYKPQRSIICLCSYKQNRKVVIIFHLNSIIWMFTALIHSHANMPFEWNEFF